MRLIIDKARNIAWPRGPRPLRPMRFAVRRLMADDGIEVAGFIAYTGLVSLFPFIIFLFALAGFIGQTARAQEAVASLLAALPAEVAATLSPIVYEVLARPQPGLLTFGILGTLWVTSSGVEALRMGLTRAYDTEEKRPFWRRRLTSLAFVVLGAISALLFTLLMVAAPVGEQWLRTHVEFPAALLVLSVTLRIMITANLLALMLAFFYRVLPNHRIAWRAAWPGAWLAAFAWIGLASLFSLYLTGAGNYAVTYGSLGGVVATLLFMHISTIIILFGAEYNAALTFDDPFGD